MCRIAPIYNCPILIQTLQENDTQPEILARGQVKRTLYKVEKEILSKIRHFSIDKKVSKTLISEIQDIFNCFLFLS